MIFVKRISVTNKILFSCLALLSGCASIATNPDLVSPAQSVIAQDFVRTMSQVDGLDPSTTVLHFLPISLPSEKEANSATLPTDCISEFFGPALKLEAAKGGYNVQTAYSVGSNISFSVSRRDKENATQGCVYDLTVGEVDFRRVYQFTKDGKAIPRQSMLVRGADVSNIELDDSIFDIDGDTASDKIASQYLTNSKLTKSKLADSELGSAQNDSELSAATDNVSAISADSDFDSPVARNDIARRKANAHRSTDELELLIVKPGETAGETENASLSPEEEAEKLGLTIASISEEDATIENSETSVRDSNGFINVRKKNIAELGLSNFEEELSDKKNVAEEILIFGDDSYVLGTRNKQLLGDMVNSFNPETDVVSVVGCSTGVTQIEHGNAALAIGRANRVKEALLYSGVPHDKIFEEGCWSPTPNSTPFPNRGVVITVKRAADAG